MKIPLNYVEITLFLSTGANQTSVNNKFLCKLLDFRVIFWTQLAVIYLQYFKKFKTLNKSL